MKRSKDFQIYLVSKMISTEILELPNNMLVSQIVILKHFVTNTFWNRIRNIIPEKKIMKYRVCFTFRETSANSIAGILCKGCYKLIRDTSGIDLQRSQHLDRCSLSRWHRKHSRLNVAGYLTRKPCLQVFVVLLNIFKLFVYKLWSCFLQRTLKVFIKQM